MTQENQAANMDVGMAASTTLLQFLLVLVAGWHADKEADRLVVERLAARPYGEIERDLRQLAQLDDAPLLSIGMVWKAKSPLELLGLFGDHIAQDQLERFFSIAQEMLATPDPQLELPDEKRYAAQVGADHTHRRNLHHRLS